MAGRPSIHSYLVYRLEDQPEQVVIWDVVAITVGRLPTQDIVVPDREVSREHAVLRKEGEVFTVEDLATTLGTSVDGQPIKRHELQAGEVIRIGPLAMKFGQRPQPIRPGPNIRFASELKGFPAPGAEGADRTVLGFSPEESRAGGPVQVEAPAARVHALAADGSLEVGDGEPTPLAELGLEEADLLAQDDLVAEDDLQQILATSVKVRDLDAELPQAEAPTEPPPLPPPPTPEAIDEAGRETAPNLPSRVLPSAAPAPQATPDDAAPQAPDATAALEAAAAAPAAAEAAPSRTASARLSIDLEGPAADVAVLVEALEGRELTVGPVRLRLSRS